MRVNQPLRQFGQPSRKRNPNKKQMKTIKTILALIAFAFTSSAIAADDADKKGPALDGYCPVCYIAAGKAVKGEESRAHEYKGETYLFVSDEALAAFKATPEKFLPAYNGHCSYGISLGKKFDGDPTKFTVVDGKIYLNGNQEVHDKFLKDSENLIKKADGEWKKINS